MRSVKLYSAVAVAAFSWGIGYLASHPSDVSGMSSVAEQETPKFSESDLAFFESKIRPVLIDKCYKCHGGEVRGKIKIKGGLDLTTREGMIKGGDTGSSFVAGNAEKSLLYQSILYTNEDLEMPPKGKMKDAILADFKVWINQGAADPRGSKKNKSSGKEEIGTDLEYDFKKGRNHWSFKKMNRVETPAANGVQGNVVDRFIQKRLDDAGIKPNGKADKRTLIRRATFDLTGLPPTETEIQSFLDDKSKNAFEKVVDRLLGSLHYGERIGRQWLDVVRYSDSNGLDENTAFGRAFEYRDYIIRSFNNDKPYDVFLTEQIAGDLLPSSKKTEKQLDQLVGTGFLCLGPKVLAEPDKEKMRIDIVDEQIDVMSKTFMGLTVSCARCHDHKFDPIPTWDYYALAGIFKSTRVMQNYNTVAKVIEKPLLAGKELKKYEDNKKLSDELNKSRKQFVRKTNKRVLAGEYKKSGYYLTAAAYQILDEKTQFRDSRAISQNLIKTNLKYDKTQYSKRGIYHTGQSGKQFIEWSYDVKKAGKYSLLMRYASQDSRQMALSINGNIVKKNAVNQKTGGYNDKDQKWFTEGKYELIAGKNVFRLESQSAVPHLFKFTITQESGHYSKKLDTIVKRKKLNDYYINKWVSVLKSKNESQLLGVWRDLIKDAKIHQNTKLFKVALKNISDGYQQKKNDHEATILKLIGEDKIGSLSDLGREYQKLIDVSLSQGKDKNKDKRKDGLSIKALLDSKGSPFTEKKKDDAIERLYSKKDKKQYKKINDQSAKIKKETDSLRRLCMQAVEDNDIKDLAVHVRGSHTALSKTRIPSRGFLRVTDDVVGLPKIKKGESGRLALAKWLTQKEHPLTARVMVNRLWGWHFGKGIVASTSNFGLKGSFPTHDKLLDFLARKFIDSGWSVKKMHKLIMLSDAYQRNSHYDAAKLQKDPNNRLLWKRDRARLEAELIRDAILATSGELNKQIGGSTLKSKSFAYVTNDQSRLVESFDSKRRAIYLPVIRNAQYGMFSTFDYPDPGSSMGVRPSTVVSHQALFMMNSPLVINASQAMGKLILADKSLNDAGRIRKIYVRAYGREASAQEVNEATAFVKDFTTMRLEDKDDKTSAMMDAWSALCHVILASSEFIYIN